MKLLFHEQKYGQEPLQLVRHRGDKWMKTKGNVKTVTASSNAMALYTPLLYNLEEADFPTQQWIS